MGLLLVVVRMQTSGKNVVRGEMERERERAHTHTHTHQRLSTHCNAPSHSLSDTTCVLLRQLLAGMRGRAGMPLASLYLVTCSRSLARKALAMARNHPPRTEERSRVIRMASCRSSRRCEGGTTNNLSFFCCVSGLLERGRERGIISHEGRTSKHRPLLASLRLTQQHPFSSYPISLLLCDTGGQLLRLPEGRLLARR